MQNQTPANTPQQAPRGRMRLPFEKRPSDIGLWSYIHRRGIAITLIAYLLFAVIFLSARITLNGRGAIDGILIEFPEEVQQEQAEPVRDRQPSYEDYTNVRNLSSNENAELNSELRDDKGRTAADLYNDAGSLSDQMQANREAYEEGLRRTEELIAANSGNAGQAQTAQDTRVQGNVTVSFSFDNPVRTSRKLVVPAYMCEGGGRVVVEAALNANGEVVSATVDKSQSTGDQCMQTTAITAARNSLFNLDTSAPSRHRGTITYIFIPQ